MSDRRSFLGGLLLGGAGLATSMAGDRIEVVRKVIVGNTKLADTLASANDGEIVVASPEDMARIGFNGETWFGVPNQLVYAMKYTEYNSWMHDHLEVNRKYGYGFKRYQDLARSWASMSTTRYQDHL